MTATSLSGRQIFPTREASTTPAGSIRATRPRSPTRAQETVDVLGETLRLFVEATGKDEALMRLQLVSKRPAELRRTQEFWRTRVEEKQRLQLKEEEAWEFFRRLPSFKPQRKEDFAEEFRAEGDDWILQRQQRRTREVLGAVDR